MLHAFECMKSVVRGQGTCVSLNIHDAVKGYRLTPVETLCRYCKQIHSTIVRPLTHAQLHRHSC